MAVYNRIIAATFFFCSCNQKTYVDESSFAVSFFRPK